MGFFSGLAQIAAPAIGSFLGGPVGASIGTGLGSYLGGQQQSDAISSANQANVQIAQENRDWQGVQNQKAMDFNAAQAKQQMDFQYDQSRTQYQRAVGDLEAAGLNPMLAVSNGGNSSMSGAAGSGVTSAGSVATVQPNVPVNRFNQAADAASTLATVKQTQAATDNTAADTANKLAQASQIAAQTKLLDAQVPNVKQDTAKKYQETWNINQDTSNKTQQNFNMRADLDRTLETINLIKQQILQSTSSARNLDASTALLGAALPKALNEANAESSGWKKNVAPYLDDAAKSARIFQMMFPMSAFSR